jgi:hypothetical protein
MTIVVTVFGALIAAFGVFGIVAPNRFIKLFDHFRGPTGLWIAVGVRLVMGVLFILAAPDCRLPTLVTAIGILALIAAVTLPIIGQRRFDALIEWWTRRPTVVIRLWMVAGGAFGGLLIYAGGWIA